MEITIIMILMMLVIQFIVSYTYKKESIILEQKLHQALERENYLLKTMNDSMRVVDTKDFMVHRMKNAPKEFKAKSIEEINPDMVD